MTYGLDTSAAIRIITGEPAALAAEVQDRIADLRDEGNAFYISALAASEIYFALQRHYRKTKEDAITSMRALADEEGFVFAPEAKAALDTPEVWKASPGFVDRMIAGEYADRGYVTLSCEKSFRRLDFAEVIREG